MLISAKQHEANRQNAQHSTGPKTPEGKEAVRDNALTYGLRTRHMILPNENLHHYLALFDAFEAEYRPCTRTEWCYLETIITSQWLLVRLAASERQICEDRPSGQTAISIIGQRLQTPRAARTRLPQRNRRPEASPKRTPRAARPGRRTRAAIHAPAVRIFHARKNPPNPSTAPPPEPTPVSSLPPWSLTIS